MNIKEYFKDDKILCTGASGFVGRNLYEFLKSQDLNVTGTYNSNGFKGLKYLDLTSKGIMDFFKIHKFKYVFMAATKTYGAGIMAKSPEALVTDNIIMNANTLDACFKNNVKKVLFISSSCVYQEAYHALTEDELDLNKPPYKLYEGVGWVKRYTEQLCKFYSGLGMPCVAVRPTNIYGKYDKYGEGAHFIPSIIKRYLEVQNPLQIWGKGHSFKNLIYINDFIRDILKVFVGYDSPEPLNLCSDNYHSIKEIVDKITTLKKGYIDIVYDPTKPDSIPYRAISRNKFDSILGKEEYTDLLRGLTETKTWMKNELNIT